MKSAVLILLLGLAAFARVTDNQAEIKVEGSKIQITAKKGFHLNAQAPASAVFDNLEALYQPTTKTEQLFIFNKLENGKVVNLSFYVCDDKKTVCEQHKQSVNLKSGATKKTEIKASYSSIQDVNLASKDGRPTLLIFSAPWCPACIRMQTETYHKPEVEKQIAKLNFTKVNSDVADNYELSEKFKIKAIPTLILLDKNGNETYRWLDFQAAPAFAKSLNAELQKVNQAEILLKNAQLGDAKSASTLAFRALNTLDYAEAVKWFALTNSPEDKKYKLSAEVSLAQERADDDEKQNEEYLQTLQKAIALTPSRLDRIRWTSDLFSKKSDLKKFDEESKVKAQGLVTEIDKLSGSKAEAAAEFKKSTYGNYAGFEQAELLWLEANVQGLLDDKVGKEKTNKRSIELLNKKKLNVSRPGEMLMAIAYLREAGEVKKVEALYADLVKAYPQSYVYFEKYARFAQKNKNLEQALSLTNEALKYPEGNEPQLSLLKVQILKDLNKKPEALAVIETTLKSEYAQHKRFARTVKKLNELKTEISKL